MAILAHWGCNKTMNGAAFTGEVQLARKAASQVKKPTPHPARDIAKMQ